MSRPLSNLILAFCAYALIAPIQAPAQSPADALDEYLIEQGLSRLRARMLEQEVTHAKGDDRLEIAERLAELYSDELENAQTPDDQREWERLARNLLSKVPELQSISMRLELAKARFAAVEKSAEQWRLRMVPDADKAQITMLLDDLSKEFRELAGRANSDVRMLEGQEQSAYGGDTDLITESLNRSRQQRSIAHYLAGWSLLYLAEMAPNRDQGASLAGDAAEEFSWLLNTTPSRVPAIDRAPEQLLKYEHMARAAIAVAACESLRGNTNKAIEWLDYVAAATELPPSAISPLFARRVWVLARDNQWSRVRTIVDARRGAANPDQTTPLSIVEARLLAILCIESDSKDPARSELLPLAIADLIAHAEHAHLLDLTRKYSSADLNLTGFLAHHVRGVRLYDRARIDQRDAGENDQLPTRIASVSKTYLDAAAAFNTASNAPDNAAFAGSRAGNLMLLGMSLYFAGEPAGKDGINSAVKALLQAAEASGTSSLASESMWMAIRVLEAHLENHSTDTDARRRMEELMSRFVDRYPSSQRTGEVALRRALRDPQANEQSLQMLLAVPEGTPQFDAARRHAEFMAYELFRQAPPSESGWLASRYIAIAEPLILIDQRLAFSGDDNAAETVVLRCRRMVDALLTMSPPDHDRAERALDTLIAMRTSGMGLDTTSTANELEGEIAYRRAQIALARGDQQTAIRIVESIREKNSQLAESAARLVIRHVAEQWSNAKPATETRINNARRLIALASPVLNNHLDAEALRDDPREAALRVMAAEAAVELWNHQSDRDMLALADRLTSTLIVAFPTDARVITTTAETAEARGNLQTALDHWRVLVSATKPGSDLWFERRLRQLAILVKLEPERARQALAQHRALYPGLAPEPYKQRFIDLEQQLGITPNTDGNNGSKHP